MSVKKKYVFIVVLLFGSLPIVYAQEGCYNCNRDSLKKEVIITTSLKNKLQLLQYIIDFEPAIDSSNFYIDQLLHLNNKLKSIDELPYLKIKEANNYRQNNENEKALQLYHEAVEVFDKQRKRIPMLLLSFRNLYNLLNKQEDRYYYYKKKLDYYIANGPFENTSSCYHGIGGYFTYTADYNQAISYYLKGADVFKKFFPYWYYNAMGIVGIYYAEWGNYEKALTYINSALPKIKATPGLRLLETANGYYEYQLAHIKFSIGKFEEVFNHSAIIINNFKFEKENRFYSIGLLYKSLALIALGDAKSAYPLLQEAKNLNNVAHNGRMTTFNSTLEIDYGLYYYYYSFKQYANAEIHLKEGYKKAVAEQTNKLQLNYLQLLADVNAKQNKYAESRKYTELFLSLSSRLDSQQNKFKIAQYENEQKHIEQLQKINQLKQEQIIQQAALSRREAFLYYSLGALIIIAASLFFVYRQFNKNKKTLKRLQATQKQLIQSEKMASLGELTAGIAHEIQNPLNFVNNFSEVNTELIEELKSELATGNMQLAIELVGDIKENEQKIIHHGKRADAIVKGMLQHSRSSNGQKEPTDINALADEYLRLAYHGLRAKDNTFNASLKTNYDNGIGKINVVPQDIGRVILNLITNAFYAVKERSLKAKSSGDNNYEPTVTVSTKKSAGTVQIIIKDNGGGIPQKVLDKIFQPFFTTKPTGEGTGLGLSLSYDIVKAHGGELMVENNKDEGAEFIINLKKNINK